MSALSIKSNVDRMARELNAQARQQIAFGTSLALNAIAQQVLHAEQENERQQLDRPRPFTVNALRVIRSDKRNLVARVVMMDRTAAYLEPYEEGGENVLNGRALLKPVGIKLDRYGNIRNGAMAKLIAKPNVFVGKVAFKKSGQTISGVWERPKLRGQQKVNKKTGKGGYGSKGDTQQKIDSVRTGLKLLIRFTDAHPIAQKNRLHWHDVAAVTVQRVADYELARGIAQALRTAKRR